MSYFQMNKMARILLLIALLFLASCSLEGNVDSIEPTLPLAEIAATTVPEATVVLEVTEAVVPTTTVTVESTAIFKLNTPTAEPSSTATEVPPTPEPTAVPIPEILILTEPTEIETSWGSYNFSIQVTGDSTIKTIQELGFMNEGIEIREDKTQALADFLATAFYYAYLEQNPNTSYTYDDFKSDPTNSEFQIHLVTGEGQDRVVSQNKFPITAIKQFSHTVIDATDEGLYIFPFGSAGAGAGYSFDELSGTLTYKTGLSDLGWLLGGMNEYLGENFPNRQVYMRNLMAPSSFVYLPTAAMQLGYAPNYATRNNYPSFETANARFDKVSASFSAQNGNMYALCKLSPSRISEELTIYLPNCSSTSDPVEQRRLLELFIQYLENYSPFKLR